MFSFFFFIRRRIAKQSSRFLCSFSFTRKIFVHECERTGFSHPKIKFFNWPMHRCNVNWITVIALPHIIRWCVIFCLILIQQFCVKFVFGFFHSWISFVCKQNYLFFWRVCRCEKKRAWTLSQLMANDLKKIQRGAKQSLRIGTRLPESKWCAIWSEIDSRWVEFLAFLLMCHDVQLRNSWLPIFVPMYAIKPFYHCTVTVILCDFTRH